MSPLSKTLVIDARPDLDSSLDQPKVRQTGWILLAIGGLVGINLTFSGFWVYQVRMLLYDDHYGYRIGPADALVWAFISSQVIVLVWSLRNYRYRHLLRSLIAPALIAANGLAISLGAALFLWEDFQSRNDLFSAPYFLVSHTIFSFAFLLSLFLATRLVVWALHCGFAPLVSSFAIRSQPDPSKSNHSNLQDPSPTTDDDVSDSTNRFAMSELFLGVSLVAITMSGVRLLLDLENSFDTYRYYVLYAIAAASCLPVLAVFSSSWKISWKLIAVIALFGLTTILGVWIRDSFPWNGRPILKFALPNMMIWQTVVFGSVGINYLLLLVAEAFHSPKCKDKGSVSLGVQRGPSPEDHNESMK